MASPLHLLFHLKHSLTPLSASKMALSLKYPQNGLPQTLKISSAPIITTGNHQQSYEDAVEVLNSLQTNVQILTALQRDRVSLNKLSLPGTIEFLERGGVSMEELDTLRVIHVAGTKGKGTTCAFTESILRAAGLKTGFFSSPHLVAVRERIRINGVPLSRVDFTKYFFKMYNRMERSKKDPEDMPGYFRFLTCMAYYVFLQEKVDVALMEVGIGGQYDSTNIVRNPIVVGITSLGLEHTNVLGDTIEEIVAAKAGIMKPSAPTFTVYSHDPYVQKLLSSHAAAVPCLLQVATPLEEYPQSIDLTLGDGHVTRINASLAIQLSNSFLRKMHPHKLPAVFLNEETPTKLLPFHIQGLRSCSWPGRFQILTPSPGLTYFLDGAHTRESLEGVLKWFLRKLDPSKTHVLLFHLTGDRQAESLLKPFAISGVFDLAIFTPPISVGSGPKTSSDSYNWATLSANEEKLSRVRRHAEIWNKCSQRNSSRVFESIDLALGHLEQLGGSAEILVTGSLHLVGGVLSILDPEVKKL